MTHLTRESSPIYNIFFFASLYNHFCFFKSALDSYLWFIIYGSSLRWSLRKFPIVAYTLVRTNQSESWLNEIGTIQSKPIIQRVLLKTRNLRSIPPQPPDKAVSSKNGPIQILNELSASKSCILIGRPIRNEIWKLLNSCSSLSFTVQSLSIPTGAIRLIHNESFYESYLLLRIWFIWILPKNLFFQILFKKEKFWHFFYDIFRMNRVLSRPCLFLRQARSYRQDMPPPGGYAAIPWRRSIPTRGFGYIGVLISGYLILRGDYISHQRYSHWRKQSMVSSGSGFLTNYQNHRCTAK